MSKTKRFEKEIDYIKTLISILFALVAGITAWFVHADDEVNLFFQIISIVLFLVFLYGIIYLHKRVEVLLDKLEEVDE
ncbi:MAG: hypothetical protein ABGW74_07815 [Campylobacterales bacterium]